MSSGVYRGGDGQIRRHKGFVRGGEGVKVENVPKNKKDVETGAGAGAGELEKKRRE